ncbi:MAG: hypothetical protein IJG38_05095 [Thermoguttaceae bacterium]|nr:hypothetical protein [Thermoguttaceae bacterium]
MKNITIANSIALLTKEDNKIMANFIAGNGIEANKEINCDEFPKGANKALAYIESYCSGDTIYTPKILAILGAAI